MDIQLHPDIEKFIGEQIRDGDYRSPDEVVTDALFLLWQHQQDLSDDTVSSVGTRPATATEGAVYTTPLALTH